jgi:hypothetical protein
MEKTQQITSVKLSEFALRHFEPKFGGTKILNLEPKEFEQRLNWELQAGTQTMVHSIIDGYAPFCKLLCVRNFTDARVGSLPITESNYIYIRHGYSKRRDGEFETFSRWLELPVPAPKANYLMIVLYSKEQMDKEALAEYNKKLADGGVESIGLEEPEPFSSDWGIVAILGQHGHEEEPMKPETFDRNYMPIEFGGSGLKFPAMPNIEKPYKEKYKEFNDELANQYYERDLKEYNEALTKYKEEMGEIRTKRKRCVDFWQNNVTVK